MAEFDIERGRCGCRFDDDHKQTQQCAIHAAQKQAEFNAGRAAGAEECSARCELEIVGMRDDSAYRDGKRDGVGWAALLCHRQAARIRKGADDG